MIRIDRRESPLAGAVVSVALLAALTIACTASSPSGSSEEPAVNEGDLVAMLPAEVTTIGFLDFAAVRETPLYEYVKRESMVGDPEQLEELIAATGIDPRTDLHRLAFVSGEGLVSAMGNAAGAVAVATFDRARVEQALAEVPTVEYQGRTLFSINRLERMREQDPEEGAEPDTGEEVEIDLEAFMTILDDSTMAFGDGDTLRAIIDVAGGAPSARDNDRLMGLLEDVDTESETWVVSAEDALFDSLGAVEGTAIQQVPVDRINAMILSLGMADGLQLSFRGRTEAEEDAKLLGDSLNGMLAFGKMMLQSNNPEIFTILDEGISAGSSGRDVTVRANLSMEDIEVLRNYAREALDQEGERGQRGE